jgi:hypothetical protein
MKLSKISVALFGAAFLLASGTFAGDVNKGKLNLEQKVNVEGKTLDAGTYRIEWNGSGPNVQVNIIKGKDTVATFPAQVTESANQNPENAYGSVSAPDGTRSLTAIYIGGKRTILQLDQNAAANQQSSTQSSK